MKYEVKLVLELLNQSANIGIINLFAEQDKHLSKVNTTTLVVDNLHSKA